MNGTPNFCLREWKCSEIDVGSDILWSISSQCDGVLISSELPCIYRQVHSWPSVAILSFKLHKIQLVPDLPECNYGISRRLTVMVCSSYWYMNSPNKLISCKKIVTSAHTVNRQYVIIWRCFTKIKASKRPCSALKCESCIQPICSVLPLLVPSILSNTLFLDTLNICLF